MSYLLWPGTYCIKFAHTMFDFSLETKPCAVHSYTMASKYAGCEFCAEVIQTVGMLCKSYIDRWYAVQKLYRPLVCCAEVIQTVGMLCKSYIDRWYAVQKLYRPLVCCAKVIQTVGMLCRSYIDRWWGDRSAQLGAEQKGENCLLSRWLPGI